MLYLIPVGTGLVLVLLVAGFFLLADLLVAAQSNLAFLGMWIVSTRSDLAGFLPFDADALSSSNIQHMAHFRIKIKDCLVKLHKKKNEIWRTPLKHPNPPIFGCASMAPLPVGQGSKEPARGGVLGVSSATSFFLNSPYRQRLPSDGHVSD